MLIALLAGNGLDRPKWPSDDKSFACGQKALRALLRAGAGAVPWFRRNLPPRIVPAAAAQSAILGSTPDSIVKQRSFLTSPRLRGEVASILRAGEGRFNKAGLAERPPHPKPSASTSPRKRGEVKNTVSRSRRAFHASFVINVSPFRREGAGRPSREGAGNAGRPMRPQMV